MATLNGERFWLRRVEQAHFAWPELVEDFDGTDGRQPLMNFSKNFVPQARSLPDDARLIVWVRQTRRIWAAVKLTGTLSDGARVCRAHGFAPDGSHQDDVWGWYYRPMRYLARFDGSNAGPPIESALRAAGVEIQLHQQSMKCVSGPEWNAIFKAVQWPGLQNAS